jgi:hypothetical protein
MYLCVHDLIARGVSRRTILRAVDICDMEHRANSSHQISMSHGASDRDRGVNGSVGKPSRCSGPGKRWRIMRTVGSVRG